MIALVRYHTKKTNLFLFIGTGFLGTGLLDGYHALVTSSFFADLFPSPPPSLIPWSWIASRLFLSVFLFSSWLAWRQEEKLSAQGRIGEGMIYLMAGVLTLASFLFFAFVPLPRAYYPEIVFHRPEEFVPALFFLVALVGYLRKGHWWHDAFEHWLVLTLLVGLMSQVVFMSFSGQLFDAMFDAAHLLKKVSYVFVLAGLLISTYNLFEQAETSAQAEASAQEITRVNDELREEVAERKRAEKALRQYAAELQRSNEELDEFAYVASHDLKAPLRSVDQLAQWIAEDVGDALPEASQRHLAQMQQRVQRMERLLDDLREYAHAGRFTHNVEDVDPATLVTGVVELLAPPASFIVEVAEDMPVLKAERVPLEQVFRNLISNAFKHHDRPDGRVTVSAQQRDGFVAFTVADDGPGIAPAYHERIFRMFQTLQSLDEREGSGMGLPLVKKLVERRGGTVALESAEGRGATFRFTWPRDQSAED